VPVKATPDRLTEPDSTSGKNKGKLSEASLLKSGAGEESRTLDLNLGKVALYQLSYSRMLLQE